MTRDELIAALNSIEWTDVEFKEASWAVPQSALSTVSAFANTEGGHLVFGVKEANGVFTITGRNRSLVDRSGTAVQRKGGASRESVVAGGDMAGDVVSGADVPHVAVLRGDVAGDVVAGSDLIDRELGVHGIRDRTIRGANVVDVARVRFDPAVDRAIQ